MSGIILRLDSQERPRCSSLSHATLVTTSLDLIGGGLIPSFALSQSDPVLAPLPLTTDWNSILNGKFKSSWWAFGFPRVTDYSQADYSNCTKYRVVYYAKFLNDNGRRLLLCSCSLGQVLREQCFWDFLGIPGVSGKELLLDDVL